MSQQIYSLRFRSGKLKLAPHHIYGDDDVLPESILHNPTEVERKVWINGTERTVVVLKASILPEGTATYWLREGDFTP